MTPTKKGSHRSIAIQSKRKPQEQHPVTLTVYLKGFLDGLPDGEAREAFELLTLKSLWKLFDSLGADVGLAFKMKDGD